MPSVKTIRSYNLCCGCGVCEAVCPQNAIKLVLGDHGGTEPSVSDQCIDCGRCTKCCPVWDVKIATLPGTTGEALHGPMFGPSRGAHALQSRHIDFLQNGTSGGFVTTMVSSLLEDGLYDAAFLTDANRFDGIVNTRRFDRSSDLTGTQKSRYIQVSHTDEVRYLLSHRDEKMIFVGTPCVFHGLLNVIKEYQLNRDNYLLLGLFCDKTMTSRVWRYFDECFARGLLKALQFRTKENCGWPGDVRIELTDGTCREIPKAERMAVKAYFMPECCLYCADKLNIAADFSVGDRYLGDPYADPAGANSIIIRTERAETLWRKYQDQFVSEPCEPEAIMKGQHLDRRKRNASFAELKKTELGFTNTKAASVSDSIREAYAVSLQKISMGRQADFSGIRSAVIKARKNQTRISNRFFGRIKAVLRRFFDRRS